MSFNRRYAAEVYDYVMSLDDDTARMVCKSLVFDVHLDDVVNNQRSINSAVESINKSLVEAASKTEHRDLVTAAVATVSKAKGSYFDDNPNTPYWDARDASGRFAAKGSGNAKGHVYITPKGKVKAARSDRKAQKLYDKGAVNITGALQRSGKQTSSFADEWHRRENIDDSTNSQMYRRIGAGAELLAHTSSSPKVQLAAQAGKFAGQFGPEAEKVIGPSLRRSAYRYRGTERRPDSALMTNKAEADRMLKPRDVNSNTEASKRAALSYLANRLPSQALSGLQLQSGKVPPSEGVLINADGKIITQAVGYSDDHYLPFNLKNLKGLQGGSYVRTRSTGGPTSEDIYAGLLSGARSVTVVSHSGVFTINFSDDFRGGRRYNDKARQMIGRYQQTLDAVQSEKVNSRSLTPAERAQIRDEVESDMGDWADRKDIEQAIQARQREFLTRPTLTTEEIQDIEANARKSAGDNEREYRQIRAAGMDAAMEAKASNVFRLDGQGYAAALDSLKEQFPYYVENVEYLHKRGGKRANGEQLDPRSDRAQAAAQRYSAGTDKGYVKPKYMRPTAAKAGWFGEGIGADKHSSEEDNYANWSRNPRNPRNGAREAETTERAAEEQPQKKSAAQRAAAATASAAASARADKHLADMVRHAKGVAISNSDIEAVAPLREVANMDEDALAAYVAKPGNREKLLSAIDVAADGLEQHHKESNDSASAANARAIREARVLYNAESSRVGGTYYSTDTPNFGNSPANPYSFKGPEYQLGATNPDVYRNKFMELAHKVKGVDLDMTDAELRNMANARGAAVVFLTGSGGDQELAQQAFARAALRTGDENMIKQVVALRDNPEQAAQRAKGYAQEAESLERMRRIKLAAGDTLTRPAESPGDAGAIGARPAPSMNMHKEAADKVFNMGKVHRNDSMRRGKLGDLAMKLTDPNAEPDDIKYAFDQLHPGDKPEARKHLGILLEED